jgi:hypothetical protein
MMKKYGLNPMQRAAMRRKSLQDYQDHKFSYKLNEVAHLLHAIPDKSTLTFKHSGNCGDIIYTLPAIYALANGKPADLALNLSGKGVYKKAHPLGNRMLSEKMVAMLKPLLESQKEINSCFIQSNEAIDVDLDIFRQLPLLLDRGNIARWHFWCWGVNYDLNKAWLVVKPNNDFKDAIVIARSARYNQPGIDYSFLKKYEKIYFVGVQEEFDAMLQTIPTLTYVPAVDFLQLAEVIAGCKLFIGNQSFPFSIAEALKVNRLLEVNYDCPNVTVYGANGFDFYFQPHFEKLVAQRYEQI